MDDQGDRGYSRAPEVEDLVALCRALNEEGVRYILIGGFAMILHGATRGTKDIDLLVDPSVENVRLLKRAMASLPDNAVAEIDDDDVQKHVVVRVADEIVIDLMGAACGVGYEEALQGSVRLDVDGVGIPTAGPEILIRTKNTYRPSDRADVMYLQERLDEEGRTG